MLARERSCLCLNKANGSLLATPVPMTLGLGFSSNNTNIAMCEEERIPERSQERPQCCFLYFASAELNLVMLNRAKQKEARHGSHRRYPTSRQEKQRKANRVRPSSHSVTTEAR